MKMTLNFGVGDWVWHRWNCMKLKVWEAITGEIKKNIETDSNISVSIRFGFLGQKSIQTGLARFFSGFFGLGSVRFFQFQAYKIKTELVGFFKILIDLIRYFSWFGFFFWFSQFNWFFIFFCSPLMSMKLDVKLPILP
jgi:hypothetical protein